jgi:hypothetical protein
MLQVIQKLTLILRIRPDNRDQPKCRAVVRMPNTTAITKSYSDGVEPSFLYQLERWMVPGWSTVQKDFRQIPFFTMYVVAGRNLPVLASGCPDKRRNLFLSIERAGMSHLHQ